MLVLIGIDSGPSPGVLVLKTGLSLEWRTKWRRRLMKRSLPSPSVLGSMKVALPACWYSQISLSQRVGVGVGTNYGLSLSSSEQVGEGGARVS